MDFKTFLLYLIICFGLSFLIGIERQYRRRIIGLRTTILVSIGAFLYVTMSFRVSNADMTRIAAQVVSGIGFLGAGVILKDGLKIRGLTTAATLWCDAAIGVLCASGAIYEAIAGTLIILFSNTVLRYVNVMINEKMDENHFADIYELKLSVFKEDVLIIKKVIDDFFRKNDRRFEIKGYNLIENRDNVKLYFRFKSSRKNSENIQKLIDDIYLNYNVKKIECDRIMEVHNEEEDEAL